MSGEGPKSPFEEVVVRGAHTLTFRSAPIVVSILQRDAQGGYVLAKHKGVTLNLHGRAGIKRPKPKHPLWRKRETLIQERIVQYTTVRLVLHLTTAVMRCTYLRYPRKPCSPADGGFV